MRPFLLLPLLLLPLLLTPSLAHSPPKEEPNEELTLLRATALGRREQALSLLSAGASPHSTERPSGWTSLMHAAHSGDVLLTRALL
jgi:ankyrin repeat protein